MNIFKHSRQLTLTLIVLLSAAFSLNAGNGTHFLKDWTMASAGKSYQVTVPTTVMGALTKQGLYKGVLEGENIQKVDGSLFATPWTFTTDFKVNKAADGRVLLKFYGVSHSANVVLNGEKIADKSQMFGTFRMFTYDVTDKVKADNRLSVEVFRAESGNFNIGYVDWNQHPADSSMGIFRPVELIVTDGPVQIASSSVHSNTILSSPTHDSWLTVDAQLCNRSDKVVKGNLVGRIDNGDGTASNEGFSFPVTLAPGEQRTVKLTSAEAACLHLQSARLWKLNVELNEGKRNVPYQMSLQFNETNGTTDDSSVTPFYIRNVETYRTAEGALGFIINGQKTLIRSGGWTDDVFMRDSAKSISDQLDMVEAMHLNAIRLEGFWGNTDEIYRQCDERGIMIQVGWSCHWEWDEYLGKAVDEKYGGVVSPEDIDLIAASFRDQITWLRVHPSIIGWFVGSDKMPIPELEQRYRTILPEIDDRAYILSASNVTSTISGRSGMKMNGPYEYVGPSYWYTDTHLGGAYGFNTETGIGAQFPQMESILRFIPKNQLWPVNSSAWKLHCTRSAAGMHSLDVLTDVMNNTFGAASNLADYLHKADLLNYQSTQAMYEAFRVNTKVTTGIVQWMLNSAWPSLYWQLYDWYGVPTSAYYATRHANEPVQAVYNYKDHSVYLVNSTTTKAVANLYVKRYDEASKLILTDSVAAVSIEPNGSVKALPLDQTGKLSYLFLTVKTQDNRIAANDYILSGTDEVDNTPKSTWFYTPIKQYATMMELNHLLPAKLAMNFRNAKSDVEGKRCIEVTLSNSSDVISFFNRLVLKDKSGNLVAPAFWNDNYVTLQPGETRHLTVSVNADVRNMTLSVDGWNAKVAAKAVK